MCQVGLSGSFTNKKTFGGRAVSGPAATGGAYPSRQDFEDREDMGERMKRRTGKRAQMNEIWKGKD